MKEYGYLVDRFAYETPTQIEEAKKELEAIAYIRSNSDLTQAKTAYALYQNLNKKPSFHTQVGLDFMRELYDVVAASGVIAPENIPPIKVEVFKPFGEPGMTLTEEERKEKKEKKTISDYRVKVRNLRIISAFLAGIIVAMFIIARNGDYSYINDYETKLVNKYAEWEEEITQREQAVREKEKELGIK